MFLCQRWRKAYLCLLVAQTSALEVRLNAISIATCTISPYPSLRSITKLFTRKISTHLLYFSIIGTSMKLRHKTITQRAILAKLQPVQYADKVIRMTAWYGCAQFRNFIQAYHAIHTLLSFSLERHPAFGTAVGGIIGGFEVFGSYGLWWS